MESAGRIGARRGKVSELTTLLPIKPSGAKRMRAFLELLHGSLGNQGVDKVGTVHDMRFVFLDNDTKLLFCTAYDGDWDPYIDDFATKIPDILDLQFGEVEGWPGIRNPEVKDFIVKHQIQALLLVRRQSEFDCGGDKTAREDRQGARRIPRQGGLRNKSDATGEAVAPPLLSDVRCGLTRSCGVFVTRSLSRETQHQSRHR